MRYDATANAIEAAGLMKRFGKTTALDGVETRPAFRASKVSNTRNWRPPTWTARPVSSRT